MCSTAVSQFSLQGSPAKCQVLDNPRHKQAGSCLARSACQCECLSSARSVQGLIFTVACDKGLMRLYDCRNYQIGPFQTFLVRPSPGMDKALPAPFTS